MNDRTDSPQAAPAPDVRTAATSPAPTAPPGADLPRAEIVHRRRGVSLAWIWPVLALAVAGWLAWGAMRARGPVITIRFDQGFGIEAGDPLTYRGLEVGAVRDVRLSPGLGSVVVEAELKPDAEGLAREGARFWVVRPDVSLRRVRGLETIIGPHYIRIEPAPEGARSRRSFTGMNEPPEVGDAPEGSLRLILRADRLGPIDAGSVVQYRDITVGEVRSWRLAPNATGVDIAITIDPEYRDLVRHNSRFWNASGIGVDWGWFAGLEVRAGSRESLVGGVNGFATPTDAGASVEDGASFELAPEPDASWLRWRPELAVGG